MSRKTTIYDIARELNITAATVSRALNNNPRISESTRKRVLETAAAMNYEPNKLALALKHGKSYNVGVVVPNIDRNFFAAIIRGIEDELYPHGYQVIICQTHEEETREAEIIGTLLNAQIDGILMSISTGTADAAHFQAILNKNVPLVLFDRNLSLEGVSSVTIDDFAGGYDATSHLIKQGCRRIAHLTVDPSLDIYHNRMEGYKQALRDNRIEINEAYIITSVNSTEGGQDAVNQLMALPEPPDAIHASSDYIALGAIQRLHQLGIKIPDEFCVIGFSNEPFTRFMELSMSSVDQSPVEMGRTAARVFLDQLENNTQEAAKVVLPAKLCLRKSSVRKSD